jgi:SAM-dependent methyltransferase
MFTDPAMGMVESARAEAKRRGLTNIQFTQCSGCELPFSHGAFDAVVSRLSVMFFPDPITGAKEALRVTVENGPVSFVVWGAKEVNPFFSVVNDVMDQFAEPLEEEPDAPDAFRFSAPGKLVEVLTKAGAENVVERRLNFQIEAAISFAQFWQLRTEMSESLRRQMACLTTTQLPLVKQTAADGAKEFFASGKMSFPAEALIVTGRRGGERRLELQKA